MFQCSGWLVLDVASSLDESSDVRYRLIQEIAGQHLPEMKLLFPSHKVDWINGQCFVLLATAHNHATDLPAILNALGKLARALPGTHGVLHWSDDEREELPESFRAIYLRNGRIEERLDPVLHED